MSTPDRPGPNERNHQEDRTGEKKKKGGQIVKKNNEKKNRKKIIIDKQRAKKDHSGRTLKIPTSRAGALA